MKLGSEMAEKVSLKSTILIDDDATNIVAAKTSAVLAIRCYPDNPGRYSPFPFQKFRIMILKQINKRFDDGKGLDIIIKEVVVDTFFD